MIQVADEIRYLRNATVERTNQLIGIRVKMDENKSSDLNQWRTFEEEIRSSLNSILASDDSRRASFQLAHDEEQQVTAVSLQLLALYSKVYLKYIKPCKSFYYKKKYCWK